MVSKVQNSIVVNNTEQAEINNVENQNSNVNTDLKNDINAISDNTTENREIDNKDNSSLDKLMSKLSVKNESSSIALLSKSTGAGNKLRSEINTKINDLLNEKTEKGLDTLKEYYSTYEEANSNSIEKDNVKAISSGDCALLDAASISLLADKITKSCVNEDSSAIIGDLTSHLYALTQCSDKEKFEKILSDVKNLLDKNENIFDKKKASADKIFNLLSKVFDDKKKALDVFSQGKYSELQKDNLKGVGVRQVVEHYNKKAVDTLINTEIKDAKSEKELNCVIHSLSNDPIFTEDQKKALTDYCQEKIASIHRQNVQTIATKLSLSDEDKAVIEALEANDKDGYFVNLMTSGGPALFDELKTVLTKSDDSSIEALNRLMVKAWNFGAFIDQSKTSTDEEKEALKNKTFDNFDNVSGVKHFVELVSSYAKESLSCY